MPKPKPEPFVSLMDVSIRLGQRLAFEGLNWEILGDQHWAVIGPNGAGKSVLTRALSGSLPVAKGRIVYHFMQGTSRKVPQDCIACVTFQGSSPARGDETFYQARWNIGVSEQAISVSDWLSEQTIHQTNPFQVVEGPRDPEFAARRQNVVEQLNLQRLLKRSIIQLSNGEWRQVSIARALLQDPRWLILDNPFAGLDESFRAKLCGYLENLMQGEMRLLIVGTSRDEIPPGVTHILSVRANRVVAQGPRQTVLEQMPRGERAHAVSTLAGFDPSPRHQAQDAVPGGTLVRMENVSVAYNGIPVLHRVNWTVRENEHWALLGPNGAGKTTLLSLILADNPQAYANNITLFGKRRGSGESIWEIKQNIGWMASELQLYYPRDASCLGVVCSGWFDSVGLYRQRSAHQSQSALDGLKQFGLAERAGTAFERVSEGEQRLVLLARALVKKPVLLVLDEPCQGLDTGNRDRVLQAIDWVGRQSTASIIYVTHRADELPRTITHVLRLNNGQVVEQPS